MIERLKTVKSQSELPELACDVELEILDGKVISVIVSNGYDYIKITKQSTYDDSLKISKPEQPEYKTAYQVSGSMFGKGDYTSEIFFDKEEAEKHINQMNQYEGFGELSIKEFEHEIEDEKIA